MIAELVEQKSALASALESFERAADILGLPADIRSTLRSPERVVPLSVPIVMPDGRIERFDGCSVVHNTARGPAMGGMRCHPGVTADELTALAMAMTWKWAVLGIPLGGGKGGVSVDLHAIPQLERDRLTRNVLEIAPPSAPAPEPAFLASDAAGRGIFCAIKAASKRAGVSLRKARVAIEGFGAAGSAAARMLAEAEATVIAASDTRGAVYNAGGLDIADLVRHKERSGSVVGFHGAEPVPDFEMLALDCDILVAAAAEHTIHSQNAGAIRARLLVEAVDRAVTPIADAILVDKGILVVPDTLANSGAVTAACQEGAQNIENVIRRGFRDVLAVSSERKLNLRMAALILGARRVAESIRTKKESK